MRQDKATGRFPSARRRVTPTIGRNAKKAKRPGNKKKEKKREPARPSSRPTGQHVPSIRDSAQQAVQQAQGDAERELPDALLDPISAELIENAVVIGCGHSFFARNAGQVALSERGVSHASSAGRAL